MSLDPAATLDRKDGTAAPSICVYRHRFRFRREQSRAAGGRKYATDKLGPICRWVDCSDGNSLVSEMLVVAYEGVTSASECSGMPTSCRVRRHVFDPGVYYVTCARTLWGILVALDNGDALGCGGLARIQELSRLWNRQRPEYCSLTR